MTCIKTGARVYLDNYNCVVAADIFRIGNSNLVHYNVNSADYSTEALEKASHTLRLPNGDYYLNREKGIIAVPSACLVAAPRKRSEG